MCITPGKLSDGQEVACRKCWQCHERKVDDWVGRCLAESKMVRETHSITLTYGRDEDGNADHLNAAILTYSDVQKYFKLLRRDGYRFRYLLAGEYGAEKGRAHWHIIMFWISKPAPHKLTIGRGSAKRYHNKYWPHGHQIAEPANDKTVRYVCKYINKDIGKDERQAMLRMSKKPPLGAAYFQALAGRYVEQGLAPQDATYRFPDVRKRDGSPKVFHMGGVTLDNFIAQFKATWAVVRGTHEPNSPLVEAYDDLQARDLIEWTRGRWGQTVYPPDGGTGPFVTTYADGREVLMSDVHGYRWYYLKDEEFWSWQKGERLGDDHPYWVARNRQTYGEASGRHDPINLALPH